MFGRTTIRCFPRERIHLSRAILSFLACFSILWAIAGCATQLSPSFDQATYTSLTDLNVKSETLFASLSKGGTSANFPAYKESYDQLIGGFSAARMAAAAREVPSGGGHLLGVSQVKAACGDDPSDCTNPTPHHLDKVITLLSAMRDTHQSGRLVGELVAGSDGHGGFKGQYEIEMNPVLIFEAALQR